MKYIEELLVLDNIGIDYLGKSYCKFFQYFGRGGYMLYILLIIFIILLRCWYNVRGILNFNM